MKWVKLIPIFTVIWYALGNCLYMNSIGGILGGIFISMPIVAAEITIYRIIKSIVNNEINKNKEKEE